MKWYDTFNYYYLSWKADMSELQLYKPAMEGDAVRELVKELGLDLSDKQIAVFTVQQILGIADGSLEIHRSPTAPLGHMHEYTAPAGLPRNGHDHI